jgi:hypothetical protein
MNLNGIAGDRVFGADFFADIQYPPFIPPLTRGDKGGCEAKSSEVPKAFGTENELKYFVSGGHAKNFTNNQGWTIWISQ